MQQENTHAAINDFFAQTIETAQQRIKVNAEINKYTGKSFSSLACVNLNENLMSWILAGLLNPLGSHGQGNIFLKLFASMVLGNENLDYSYVTVRCEAMSYNIERNRRRIDICLTGKNWVCAIENKPKAYEQEEQLEDYAKHIEAMKKKHNFLVFLAPAHVKPQTLHSEAYQKYLRLWSLTGEPLMQEEQIKPKKETELASFFAWTLACRQHCEAPKVRYFIEDFENAVHTFIW